MKLFNAIAGGLAGAITLTLVQQWLKRHYTDAPRMDLLGMEITRRKLEKMHVKTPPDKILCPMALTGELVANTAFYSLAAIPGRHAIAAGTILGLAAGAGGVLLPGKAGLPPQPATSTYRTPVLTVSMYLAAGLAAGTMISLLNKINTCPEERL